MVEDVKNVIAIVSMPIIIESLVIEESVELGNDIPAVLVGDIDISIVWVIDMSMIVWLEEES